MTAPSITEENVIFQGPWFHVDLAALDALHPIHYSRRLLLFRCASHSQFDAQLGALKIAVKALVRRCPILGGTIAPPPTTPSDTTKISADWRTVLPGPGIELVVKDLRNALPPYSELEASGFAADKLPYDLLVPVPGDIGNDRPFAACKLQFSAIQGGSILTWAMSHSIADGSGNNELIRILAEETRLATEKLSSGDTTSTNAAISSIGLDRSILRIMTSNIPFRIEEHPGYMESPPSQPPSHPFVSPEPEMPISLHIPSSCLAQLKADAQKPGTPPISTHDAICALLWRSVTFLRHQRSESAKSVALSTPINLYFPSDGRRHLKIPDSYIGNAVYQLSTALDLGTILSPTTGLQEAAAAIRRAITAVTPEKMRSLMARTNEQWVDWAFMRDYNSTGVPMGTDWTSSSLYDHDWGTSFGKLVRFRYPGEEGSTAILPKLPDGSAEVMVAVMKSEVEVLKGDECFGKYIQ